jgi:hypothetical protein
MLSHPFAVHLQWGWLLHPNVKCPGWEKQQSLFRRITLKALEIVNFENIYDMHIADRMGIMLNE